MDERFMSAGEVVLTDILEQRAAAHPGKVFALFDDGASWTYEETARRAWSMAAGLLDLGVRPGDHVLSWLPTGSAALQAWLGINGAGGIYTPLNTSYRGRILEHAVNTAGADTMIVHSALLDRLQEIEADRLRTLIVVGEGPPRGTRRFLAFDDLASGAPARPRLEVPREPWDDMAVIFTSGTTGPSKGVRCSYLHHWTYGGNMFPSELGADDRYYLCLPMYHAAATNAIYTFMKRSGSVAFTERFSTSQFWPDVRSFGATCSNVAAAMARFLYNAPRSQDDGDNPLRLAYMGPILDEIEDFCDRFGMRVYTCYGSTEVPCPIFTGPISSGTRSLGQLRGRGFDVRVVDEHDGEVPPGQVGELIVRHDTPWTMFSGYLGMPEVTAEVWRNGWFHTGDAVRLDDSGDYYFTDRVRDTIRRRAENIASVDVEAELSAHPAILEAAVIGVPSELSEDEVMALLVLRPGETVQYEQLIEYLVTKLPYFMVPRYVEIVDDLPRTETAKVKKYELRVRGVTADTWDREEAGIRLGAERLGEAPPRTR